MKNFKILADDVLSLTDCRYIKNILHDDGIDLIYMAEILMRYFKRRRLHISVSTHGEEIRIFDGNHEIAIISFNN